MALALGLGQGALESVEAKVKIPIRRELKPDLISHQAFVWEGACDPVARVCCVS